jgi:ferritin
MSSTTPITTSTTKQDRKGLAKSNYQKDSEDGVNQIINSTLDVCDGLLSMVYYFKRVDNSEYGFADFYDDLSKEYYWLSRSLMDYQILRGGHVQLVDLKPIERTMEWNTGIESLNHVLERLKNLNLKFHELHKLAKNNNDPCVTNFIEHHFISKTVNDILRVSNKITKFNRVGTSGLGQYVADRDLQLMVEGELDDIGSTETDEEELIPNL